MFIDSEQPETSSQEALEDRRTSAQWCWSSAQGTFSMLGSSSKGDIFKESSPISTGI